MLYVCVNEILARAPNEQDMDVLMDGANALQQVAIRIHDLARQNTRRRLQAAEDEEEEVTID